MIVSFRGVFRKFVSALNSIDLSPVKDIPRLKGRKYISQLIAEGEHSHQDFKFAISDARKIARSISAFANAEGGRLLIGVKDNGTVAGVRNEEDIFVVEQAASLYCSPAVEVDFTAFSFDSNITVIRASIPRVAERPVRAQEPDGSWRAYFRVADENIVAHPLMVRAWKSKSVSLSLTDEVSRLISLLELHPDGLDLAQIPKALSLSQRTTDGIIVNLLSSGIATFVYHAPKFLITLLSPDA